MATIVLVENQYILNYLRLNRLDLTLPDEYQYIVKEILRKGHVDARTIDSIHIKSFEYREYDEEHRRLFHRWLFYPHVRHNFTCDEISKKYKFYTYLDLSNSFPRFFTYTYQFQMEPVTRLNIPCSSLREIIRDKGIRLYKNSNVYFGIYAIDVNAKIEGPFCKERNEENRDHCIVADTIKGSDSRCCVKAQEPRYFNNFVNNFVKVLTRSVKDGLWDPVTIGYKINNTRVLEIDLNYSQIIQEQFESIMRRINDNRSRKLEPSYYELSINTALVNSLMHILTSDLPIVYYFELMGSLKTADLIKLAFLHHELRSSDNITELIYNVDNAKPIIDITRNFINNYNNDDLALLLRYFMSKLGRRYKLITLFMGGKVNDSNLLQKVSDRLQNILNKYKEGNNDWKIGAIFDLVRHTFSHHLIRTMSTRGGVMAGKFLEQYEELSTDPITIVEKDSGGIGVMRKGEYILDIWKNGETLVEDLLLSLGKCLIGTPEDLIHFAIVKRKDELSRVVKDDIKPIKELTRLFKQVADDLGIIVTPDELKETVKQWLSVFEEATRIGKLIGEDAFNILWRIHSVRYDFERKYRRFPDFDELIIYTVMVISKYPTLRKLIRVLLRRALSQRNLTNVLRNLYGAENSEERFIDDVSSMLETLAAGSNVEQNDQKYYILKCLRPRRRQRSNQSIDDCEGVISSLVLLRKVITSVLTRLALLSCNGACGMCYVNSRSCGRFGAPFIQARTLDRRLLKILASMIIEKVGKALDGELAYSNGVIVEFRGKTYSLGCGG